MKNLVKSLSRSFKVAGKYFLLLKDKIVHPLKDMPVPDFNNQYDSTML
jgi:hypothetical protein